jgi:hypothetical protein
MDYNREQKMQDIEQRWDFTTRRWINSIRNDFIYDEEGELVEETKYRWDRADNQWAIEARFLYTDVKPEGIDS